MRESAMLCRVAMAKIVAGNAALDRRKQLRECKRHELRAANAYRAEARSRS